VPRGANPIRLLFGVYLLSIISYTSSIIYSNCSYHTEMI
jgi:hypothetical protein